MTTMIAASSIVKTNLPCSSRISSWSDFTSGHSWRPLEAAKHYRAHGVRSLRITCAATKTAKSPAEEEWKIKRQLLLEKRVRSVDVKEALRLQKENGFVILDVRPEAEFKQAHPPGAVNVQIYRLIKEWTAWDIARRAAFAFFGIFAGTEENPEFIKSVEEKLGKDAKIIVACSAGGTMKPTLNLPDGKQSRYIMLAKHYLPLNLIPFHGLFVGQADLDNRWVVPYNPFLLMRYNCHINVEACSSIKAVKYLFKYIYKGHDKASFACEQDIINDGGIINEIRQYRDARFVSPPDAMYMIYGYKLFGVSPSVLQLQLHLQNMNTVAFKACENLEDVIARPSSSKSMLTEYFEMNRKFPTARKWLYREFPEHYRWIAGDKKWQNRKSKRSQIGRLVYAHPAEGDRYYLRVLLSHVRGATSFDHLKTVNGKLCGSFREACELLGLIEHDKTLDHCMTEAATFQMPCALRRLFATILVFCEATEIRQMWDKHLASMSEDYRLNQSNDATIEQMVLRDIRDMLQSMGKDITSYGLPDLVETDGSYGTEYREVTEERQVTVDKEHLDLFGTLNSEQLAGFNDIMDHVTNKKGQIFFVDGPGGTGKTYLYKALLAKVRSMGLIAIATATSGIAASIMPGGRTAHSRFKIPIKLKDNSMCSFTKQSGTAELLKQASLIIWDEVAMTKRQAVETLDRSLQDIMECPLPFGGKVVVFGGDFRQVLPVVTRGTRAQITDATVLRSYLWEKTRKIRLTRNMRAQADPWFSEYLLRVGNGTEETIGDDYVRLPDDIVIGYTENEKAINRLIKDVFPALNANARSREYMSARAILSTKNEHVDDLNDKMISRFPGEERLYHSFDSIDDDLQNNYTIDFLNSITPNGLPPHVLKLKVNCPVILLRNLDPHNGLCNGTRLMIRAFQDNAIDAEIVGGQHAGKRVFIPRIPMSPSDDISLPFKLKRKQFPIRLSFAMTINKAQGQTIPHVGIYLPEPVFSHGQLYVALSRGVSRKTTRILAKPNNEVDKSGKSTKNIVYRDVLQG